MKILVTGGAGFIGSNLVEELVRKGHEVTVLDTLSFGSLENLKKVIDEIKIIESDIRDKKAVNEAVKNSDYVVNLAAISSSQMFHPSPREGYEVGCIGFNNILEACVKNKIKKIVYASTSSLYSRTDPPHGEGAIIKPGTFYEHTKMINEDLARIYGEMSGLNSIGLRFFAVYGPHENHKGIHANMISQFIWSMMKGKQPEIWGDGTQTRDFTYVSDIVEGIIRSLGSNYSGILNLGSGKACTLNELVEILNKKLGTSITPKYVQNPIKNYVRHTLADTALAKEKIGFVAETSLEEGVEKTVSYYEQNPPKNSSL